MPGKPKSAKFKSAEIAYEADDVEEAIRLFKEIALDEPEAYREISFIYKHCPELPSAQDESEKYFQIYIERIESLSVKDPYYKFVLGTMLEYGDGLKADPQRAFDLICQAAEDDEADAQEHLSFLYESGQCGVEPDEQMSRYWLRRAIAHNHPDALYREAAILLSNKTLKQGDAVARAKALLSRAASLGNWRAQGLLDTL
ncbi:MAG: sel1 repeat family protein [Gammaproteobacteria bacterium]|nr:sel1 repeat family protein [Gammaproteobacteria bacterium]